MLSLLTNGFYNVVGTDILTGQDFFTYRESDFDAIVTNPPYSVKYQWLKRCYELGKPYRIVFYESDLSNLSVDRDEKLWVFRGEDGTRS